jgi:hypothetical protein
VRLVVHLDPHGVMEVDTIALPEEADAVHRFYEAALPAIKQLGAAVRSLSDLDKIVNETVTEVLRAPQR